MLKQRLMMLPISLLATNSFAATDQEIAKKIEKEIRDSFSVNVSLQENGDFKIFKNCQYKKFKTELTLKEEGGMSSSMTSDLTYISYADGTSKRIDLSSKFGGQEFKFLKNCINPNQKLTSNTSIELMKEDLNKLFGKNAFHKPFAIQKGNTISFAFDTFFEKYTGVVVELTPEKTFKKATYSMSIRK